MPKPKESIRLNDGDLLQLKYSYKTFSKAHKFSLCYQVLFGEDGSLSIQDRDLANSLNNVIIKNCLIHYFSEETTFFAVELILFSGSEPYFRDRFGIRPPIEGIANKDDQVSYSGTYTTQFRHKEVGFPAIQLGR